MAVSVPPGSPRPATSHSLSSRVVLQEAWTVPFHERRVERPTFRLSGGPRLSPKSRSVHVLSRVVSFSAVSQKMFVFCKEHKNKNPLGPKPCEAAPSDFRYVPEPRIMGDPESKASEHDETSWRWQLSRKILGRARCVLSWMKIHICDTFSFTAKQSQMI